MIDNYFRIIESCNNNQNYRKHDDIMLLNQYQCEKDSERLLYGVISHNIAYTNIEAQYYYDKHKRLHDTYRIRRHNRKHYYDNIITKKCLYIEKPILKTII